MQRQPKPSSVSPSPVHHQDCLANNGAGDSKARQEYLQHPDGRLLTHPPHQHDQPGLNCNQFRTMLACFEPFFSSNLDPGNDLRHYHGQLVPRVGDHSERYLHDGPRLYLPLHLCQVTFSSCALCSCFLSWICFFVHFIPFLKKPSTHCDHQDHRDLVALQPCLPLPCHHV